MKKIIFSLFTLLIISSQPIVAAGYIAIYSLNVSDPASYSKSLDNLMNSDWGKSFPANVSLHQYVFNGYDDATHAVVLDYDDAESLGVATELFNDPQFIMHLSETSSMLTNVEESLHMKLISGGSTEPENNGFNTVYRMKVNDPSSYAMAYTELIAELEEAGDIIGTYGLRQNIGGDVNYYSHYAYTSAGSMSQAMESAETLYASEDFAEFSEKVSGNRELISISVLSNIISYSN